MIKERYKEEYKEGSDLLCPSDKEDKITPQFYKDISNLSTLIFTLLAPFLIFAVIVSVYFFH